MNLPREATKEDMPRVLELIAELAVFENEPDAVKINVDALIESGFGTQPKFKCFVIEDADKIQGMALVFFRFSTWVGKVLHLEDLIVTKSGRGKGYGKLLLDAVVKFGKQSQVKRISWEVLDWNEPAIKFYEKNGANVMRNWDVVQLNEKGIENYLSKL